MGNQAYSVVVRSLAAVLLLWAASPSTALQVTFPLEAGDVEGTAQAISLRARSLKEYFDRFQVSYAGDFYRYGTYGNRARAFRPDNFYQQHMFGLIGAKKLKNGLNYEINMTLRNVNDPVVTNRKDMHFTAFYATLFRQDRWSIRAGDLYPNLSRYAFNRFSKGFMGTFQHDIGSIPKLGPARIKTAVVASRTERARENSTLRRTAIAGTLGFESLGLERNKPKWSFGYRHSHAADQLKSVNNHGSLADLHLGVHAIGYTAELKKGWSIDGENAWSRGTSNRKAAVGTLGDVLGPDEAWGYAWLTNVSWLKPYGTPAFEGVSRLRPFAFQANFELVDPYFRTALGVASADQLRYSARTAHRWNENLDWTFSHLRLEDNVRNQKSATSISRTTSVAMNYAPFKLVDSKYSTWVDKLPETIRNIRSSLEFRFNDRDKTDGTTNAKIEDYIYSLTYTNWNWTFKNDFSFQITDDDATPTSDRRVQTWGLAASRSFHWPKWDMRFFPRASYRLSEDRFRLTGTATRLQVTNFGLGANWEELSGNIGYTIEDSDRNPATNDYLKNQLNISGTYRPYLFPGFQGTALLGYTDVNDETLSRSYRQVETRLSVRYVF